MISESSPRKKKQSKQPVNRAMQSPVSREYFVPGHGMVAAASPQEATELAGRNEQVITKAEEGDGNR